MIDFWFDFASPYSYIGALRIEAAARVSGEQVRWRPFLLGAVFKSLGYDAPPFGSHPVRAKYMVRDLERLAQKFGFPFQMPSVFPQKSVLANRVVCSALEQPWCGDFIRATFRAEFGDGKDISNPDVLGEVLGSLALEPGPILEEAASDPIKQQLRAFTEQALSMGVFGAPNLVVNGELFFGEDRIDDALDWAKRGNG